MPGLPGQVSDLHFEVRRIYVPLNYGSKLLEVYEIVQDIRNPDLSHLSTLSNVELVKLLDSLGSH